MKRKEETARRTECVIIDTREKKPWKFKQQRVQKVEFGDYTLSKGKTKVLIERKGSIYDLYGTMRPKNRKRFMDNMAKAVKKIDHVFLVLETSLGAVYFGVKESPVPSYVVVECLLELMELGIQVIFTGGTKHSAHDLVERILYRFGSL